LKKRLQLGTAVLIILLTGVIQPVSAATPAFSDISRHWAQASITSIAARGYLNGYPDGTYRPETNMTRAEFITALIACLGAEHNDTITSNFSDTTAHWAKTQINEAVRRGILKPWEYPNGLKPDGPILRSEVAAILVRAKGVSAASAKITFKDDAAVQQSDYRDYIRTACTQKLMSGFPDGEFKPFNKITRGQAATVLATYLGINSGTSAPTGQIPAGWTVVVDGNQYDLSTVPVYFKSGFNDIRITSIASANDKVIFNNTYSFSSGGNLELVIYNTAYTVAKMSVSSNQLLVSASSTRLNSVTVGEHKYDAAFIKLYISNTNGEHYLSDAMLLDQYNLKIDGQTYDVSNSKITIALGEKYYDIRKIIFSPTITSLQLTETDPVISDGLTLSNISAIFVGDDNIDLDEVDRIDFIIGRSMYGLSRVTIDASGNFSVGSKIYPASDVIMLIDGSYYQINTVDMYKGKFMIYAEPDENGSRVLFNDEYRLASEVVILKNNDSYSLDQIMIVGRNLIRIGGKQYSVDSTIRCKLQNKVYAIDEIDYSTKYDMVSIEADETDDYAGAYQPKKYVFYLSDEIYREGISNVTIYVNGSYRKFDLISIIDPARFTYNNRTYDLIDSRIGVGSKYFTIADTVWHGQSQTFDFYLEELD
jgi:hypothetical protein